MQLSTYIKDLLYRYECVIIPNFGGFVTNEISAKVNAFTHTFNAPSKQLTFNSHLQNNDGLLANYIANVANVSYSNAVEIINAEVKNWKLQLKNEEIELKNINPFAVDVETIKDDDIVVRVMTFEHVPEENRKNKPKTEADLHSKCNFPPFKHYAYIEGELKEVARSHWEGGLDNGYFNVSHGGTTNTLGGMYIKLCERYSMRGNWRGYTYVDEMRGQALVQLSQIGLQFNEAKSDNPFAYYTAAINNSFTRVLNLEKRSQNIRDDLLEEEGLNPSSTRTFNAEWEAHIKNEAKKKEMNPTVKVTNYKVPEVDNEETGE